MPRLREVRMIPVAAAVWAAAAAATMLPDAAAGIAAGLWAAGAAAVLLSVRAGGRRRIVALTAIALVLAAAAASHAALAQPGRHEVTSAAIGGGRAIVAHVTVVGKANPTAAGDIVFDAQLHRIDAGARIVPADAPARVRVAADEVRRAGGVDIGDEVTAAGTASAALPGQRAVVVIRASRGLEVSYRAGGVLGAAAALRRGLARSAQGLPEPGAGLIPGLAVGDTAGVGADLDAAMKSSSLSHLTAVSGANCAIVVGLAFAAAAGCGARRGIRVAAGLLALGGFVLLVSPQPSVVRAAAMAAIAMLGVQLGRAGAGTALLAMAVTMSLVADPWLSTALGFALSAAATGGLLLLARPLAQGLARWMPRALALSIAVPLAAQLACGPLLILVNPTVPLYGVVANLLAAPAAPIATVTGLAACLALPIPALQAGLTAITWLPAAWIGATATITSALPAHGLPWLDGLLGAVGLALLGAAITVVIVAPARSAASAPSAAAPGSAPSVPRRPRRHRRRWQPLAWIRVASAAGIAAVLGVWAGGVVLGSAAAPLTVPTGWAIALCDVGQGDGILLRSAGRVALIDTGPEVAALDACLRRMGIDRVDLLVLTHYDHDHAGATDAVRGRVGTVLFGPPGSARDEAIVRRLVAAGAQATQAYAGLSGVLGGASWAALWPPPDSKAYPSGNEACIVLDVRGGGVPASLFLCDTDAVAQRGLLRSDMLRPPYQVVKVAHHGSADQEPELYRRLGARLALISVGARNDYGHPRAGTLAFLGADGMTVARTDREGMIAVVATPGGVGVWRERAP